MKNTHGAIQAASTATGRYHPPIVAQHLVLGCHPEVMGLPTKQSRGQPWFFCSSRTPTLQSQEPAPHLYLPRSKHDSPTHSSESSAITYVSLLELRKIPAKSCSSKNKDHQGSKPWHCSLLCPWDLEVPSLPHCLETMATGMKRETWHQRELSLGTRGRPAYVLPL